MAPRPPQEEGADDAAEAALLRTLRGVAGSTVETIIAAIRRLVLSRDPTLVDHQDGVAAYATPIAAVLGWPQEVIAQVRMAALVHDLGKLLLPSRFLSTPGPLTATEYARMQEHPSVGSRLLLAAGLPAAIAVMVHDHHERWDGGGYPARHAGTAITPGGRVLAVADALDAMVRDRPYAARRPLATALAEIERCAGGQFDPDVVAALRCTVTHHSLASLESERHALSR